MKASTLVAQQVNTQSSNPLHEMKYPKRDTEERQCLPHIQAMEVLEKIDVSSAGSFIVGVCISTGMRRGEVTALSWKDVNFENKTISVKHNYTIEGIYKETKPKLECEPFHCSKTPRNCS